MKITWQWSPETEILRLIQAARNIAIGFYRFHNFLIYPNLPSGRQANSVVFPKLNYMSIPRFWDQVKKLDTDTYPFPVPQKLVNNVQKLTNFTEPKHINIPQSIFPEISRLLPEFKQIREIIIMPTNFGTTCSFSTDPETGKIYIWLRSDSTLIHVIESILSCLTRNELSNQLDANWAETEIVIDWFISRYFRKFDPNWQNALTISSLRTKQNGTQKQKSDCYIASLGTPIVTPETLQKVDLTIFPPMQQTIFKLLLDKAPQVVTNDDIIDHLYPNDPDKFSLYAIAKQIQRLRNLLEKRGISGSFIQTKRGEGYFLTN